MKRVTFLLSALVLLLGTTAFGQTPVRYENHQAVILTGCTVEASKDGSYEWGRDRGNLDEFWNDTYLMWEALVSQGWYVDRVHVLYGDGEDHWVNWYRYTAQYVDPNLDKITDFPAYKADVENIYNWLAYGSAPHNIE